MINEKIPTIILLGLVLAFTNSSVATAQTRGTNYCLESVSLLKKACAHEFEDDYNVGLAYCLNIENNGQRRRCENEVKREKNASQEDCQNCEKARKQNCRLLGSGRYDPDFTPENFVDPALIGVSIEANPYFPLVKGYQWVYQGDGETITDTITGKYKMIQGVKCVVQTDVVVKNNNAIEITDDWFAQDKAGNVWYCGELSQDFETFVGDSPAEPELVQIDGAWKTGVERAQPGILMYRNPKVGQTYRQEVKFGDAEDIARVISVDATESTPGGSCNGTCVKTRDFTPLDPENIEMKVFAPGIGKIVEFSSEGVRTQLVQFNRP